MTRPSLENIPWVTLALIALMIVISLLAPEPSARFDLLVLDREEPRTWPWLTAHWLHTDTVHIGWNVVAFGCLGALGETLDRSRFLTAIAMGIVAVDVWFAAWINVDLRFYCGFSGVLNTVLLVTLYTLRGRVAARWLIVAAVLVASKLGWEWHSGAALLTQSRWPSAVGAHIAGFAAALPLLAVFAWRDRRADTRPAAT